MINFDIRKSFVILIFLLSIFLVGCTTEEEDFIQGYWYRGNVHFMDQWFFDRGTFVHKSEVFHGSPNILSGRYQVIDSDAESITLELFDLDLTFGDEHQQITIKLDRDSDLVHIRSQDFERILP
jgi:hypothetical protein